MRLHAVIIISLLILIGVNASGQVINNNNSFPAASSANPGYLGSSTVASPTAKLYVGGSVKLFNTGNSGFGSPSLYLANRTAGARNYYLNSSSTGLFQIVDSNANLARFVINTAGNVGIGTTAPSALFHTVGSVRYDLGSDATGDIYYRNASGLFTRLPIGTAGQVLTVSSGLPAWAAAGGGGGSGTVTNFIFTNQNGFTGTVTTSTSTPTLTLSTSLNGLLRGNGTALVTGQANLATEVTGVLPIANGGTGVSNNATGFSVFAGPPSGLDGAPSFRSLVTGDIPSLDMSKITTGNLSVNRIGNIATNRLLGRYSNGSGVVEEITIGTGLNLSSTGELTVSGGGGAVSSVFGRSGAVVAQAGDYTFAQIGSTPTTLAGYGITDAIRNGTSVQSGANFNISGNGTIGNNLTVTGTTLQLGSFSQSNQVKMNFRQLFNATGYGWDVGYASPTSSDFLILSGESGSAFRLNMNSAERMTVLSNGNVGIGNISPSQKLHINGITQFDGVQYLNDANGLDGTKWGIYGWDNNLHISKRNAAWGYDFSAILINQNGNVGIGTSGDPTAKLHTNGSIRFEGLTTNNTLTNILATDALGNISWRDASTFGGGGSNLWTDGGSGNVYNTGLNGKLGINTSTANADLDVQPRPGQYYPTIRVGNTSLTDYNGSGNLTHLTNSAGAYEIKFGTNINKMVFTTNSLERMTINSAGDVGIGTATPGYKLDVNGTMRASSVYSDVIRTESGAGSIMNFYTGSNQRFALEDGSGGWARVFGNLSTTGEIHPGGRIFLGGTTAYLHGQFADILAKRVGANHSSQSTLILDDDAASGAPSGYKILNLKSGGVTRAYINSTGGAYYADAVSIATTNIPATYKLAVGGNIIAEKVRVKLQSTGWPDYVFNTDYNLLTLGETEKFIQQHKHLPGVPSAAVIEKEGLDLGDGQAVLLKKIEELTLHMIDMNKKLEKLAAENEIMKRKIEKGDK
jgi:hypothetical protein